MVIGCHVNYANGGNLDSTRWRCAAYCGSISGSYISFLIYTIVNDRERLLEVIAVMNYTSKHEILLPFLSVLPQVQNVSSTALTVL